MEEKSGDIKSHNKIKVVVSGPESTGKTELSMNLAAHYQTAWIPEYARSYVSDLKRPYKYNDLVNIALKQIYDFKHPPQNSGRIIIYDTGLIITKIWFKEVFNNYPDWLDEEIKSSKTDLYLLCYYDLPWQFDSLRENGSDERRAYLFEQYLNEIKKTGCDFKIIRGFNQERLNLAIKIIDQFILDNVKK
jgi:nicotinamide riboside kinase